MQSSRSVKSQNDELQISEFIKDPTTLKLLILAGTNIRASQLSTVSKCISLIKLDLSSNVLSQLPLNFHNFHNLKILLLHDNNLFQVKIQKTNVEYLSLFKNPIQNYRKTIVQNNSKLLAIDYNVITQAQRIKLRPPNKYTQIKWPIVEASSNLQSQEDYLNLLKAQIFVINNLFKKSNTFQKAASYLESFFQYKKYQKLLNSMTDQMKMRKQCVLDSVSQWKNYTQKKLKLAKILEKSGKKHLLNNHLELNRLKRSPPVAAVVQNFIKSIRLRMAARKVLQKHLVAYRQYVKNNFINQTIKTKSQKQGQYKLYFIESQLFFVQKIFLYCKRLFFNEKDYDLCDNFQNLVKKDKKQYYIFRAKQKNFQQKSFLLDSIRRTMSLIIRQKNLDRQHFLYNRKGHKQIGIKRSQKQFKVKYQTISQKCKITQQKVDNKYKHYQTLVSLTIYHQKIFDYLIKIIKFFNAGNSSTILSNQTAYFQTQVIFNEDQNIKLQDKIYVGLQFHVKRVISANIIQRFWRKVMSKTKSKVQIISTIKKKRSKKLICKWLNDMIFNHRMLMNKTNSFLKTIWKHKQVYIHLQIYMNLPEPTDFLRMGRITNKNYYSKDELYKLLHLNTIVQIVQSFGRRWIKIVFSSSKEAFEVQKLLAYNTYRFYYNGFYLKLFNSYEIQDIKSLEVYEQKIKKLFQIEVHVGYVNERQNTGKKISIQNSNSYFLWTQLGQFESIDEKFKINKGSIPVSVFLYNKHQKPLKMNCYINWINPNSIYSFKKQTAKPMIRSRSKSISKKNSLNKIDPLDLPASKQHFFSKIRKSMDQRSRRNSQIHPHVGSLTKNQGHKLRSKRASQHIQINLLSETLNIRRR